MHPESATRRGMVEDDLTKRLLRLCSRRAIEKLHADLEAATANPETAHQIIRNASEADLSLLRGLYTRSVGVTLSTVGVAFFGVLPRRRRPIVSAAVAVGFGSVAGVVYGGHTRHTATPWFTYGYTLGYMLLQPGFVWLQESQWPRSSRRLWARRRRLCWQTR